MKKKLLLYAICFSISGIFNAFNMVAASGVKDTAFIKIDMSLYGNGLIYDINGYSKDIAGLRNLPKNDYIAIISNQDAAYKGKPSSLGSLLSKDAGKSITLNGVEYSLGEKCSAENKKEGINLRNGEKLEIDIPDGFYKSVNYLGLTNESKHSITIGIECYDSEAYTLSARTLSDYSKKSGTYVALDAYTYWNYPWDSRVLGTATMNIFPYSADTETENVIDKISFLSNGYTTIPAITCELDVTKTKNHLEGMLAQGIDSIIENNDRINEMLKTLEGAGVKRKDIIGAEIIDNIENEIKKRDIGIYLGKGLIEVIRNIDDIEALLTELEESGEDITGIEGIERYENLVTEAKEYVEKELLKEQEEIKEEKDVLEEIVGYLSENGIKRREIEGIEKLDECITEKVTADIKSQANGLIYLSSQNDFKKISYEQISDHDFMYKFSGGATQRYAMKKEKAGKEITVGDTVYVLPSMRKNDNLSDKEGIITRSGETVTIDIPKGKYDKINILMLAATNDNEGKIGINYSGEEAKPEVFTIYGSASTPDASVVNVKRSDAISMFKVWSWEESWTSCSNENCYLFSYEIDADNEKVAESIVLTTPYTSSMTVAVTGDYLVRSTLSYLEEEISGADIGFEKMLYLDEIITTLKNSGIDESEIEGIEEFRKICSDFLWVSESTVETDTKESLISFRFSQAVDEESLNNKNIIITKYKEALKEYDYRIEPVKDSGECIGVDVYIKHHFDYGTEYEVELAEQIISKGGVRLTKPQVYKVMPAKTMGISDFDVSLNESEDDISVIEFACKLVNNTDKTDENTVFIGMYSYENELIDFYINSEERTSGNLSISGSFGIPGKGEYHFKCMLIDSYNNPVALDEMLWRSVTIEE